MNYLNVGDKAPSFSLISSEKKMVSLSDFEGKKLLLLFFPFAFTGTCSKELCEMRDDIANYSDLETAVLGISVDSPHTLRKFKEELQLPFPLLSDFNKVAIKAYGCIHEEFALGLKGVAKRSAFVIDGEGIIKYIEILDNSDLLPNFDSINSTLQSIK